MTEELLPQLEGHGYKGRIVSIQHLSDLQEEIEGHHRQGLFDEEFYQKLLTWLAAFCSDLPCLEDHWQEPQMLERCQNCSACLRNCPTGAIPSATPSTLRPGSGQASLRAGTSKRFLLRVERCITFHNEKAGDIPFPDWLDPSWHNCLVGCLDCQRICPQNKEFLEWVEEGAEFSPEETALILEGAPFDQLPAQTAAKWKQLGLDEDYDIFPRNLRVLLRR